MGGKTDFADTIEVSSPPPFPSRKKRGGRESGFEKAGAGEEEWGYHTVGVVGVKREGRGGVCCMPFSKRSNGV